MKTLQKKKKILSIQKYGKEKGIETFLLNLHASHLSPYLEYNPHDTERRIVVMKCEVELIFIVILSLLP